MKRTMRERPTVSVGMPVRNGGEWLEEALRRVLAQTYTDLEVIISDNGSTDQTRAVCERFQGEDPRVRYHRQDRPLTVIENFRFVFERARGDYFMWAAHDDRHSPNYVETLVGALDAAPGAALAFTDSVVFSSHAAIEEGWRIPHPERMARTKARSWRRTLSKGLHPNHMYGLIRSDVLRDYPWYDIDYGPDYPLLSFLALRGDFVYRAGGCFYSYKPATRKNPVDRAVANYGKRLRPLPRLRLSWLIAKVVRDVASLEGRSRTAAGSLPYSYWVYLKPSLYTLAPTVLKRAWARALLALSGDAPTPTGANGAKRPGGLP